MLNNKKQLIKIEITGSGANDIEGKYNDLNVTPKNIMNIKTDCIQKRLT